MLHRRALGEGLLVLAVAGVEGWGKARHSCMWRGGGMQAGGSSQGCGRLTSSRSPEL